MDTEDGIDLKTIASLLRPTKEDLRTKSLIESYVVRCRVGCFGSRTDASPSPLLPHLETNWNSKEI